VPRHGHPHGGLGAQGDRPGAGRRPIACYGAEPGPGRFSDSPKPTASLGDPDLITFSYGAVKESHSSVVHFSWQSHSRSKTLKNTTRLNFGDGDEWSPDVHGEDDRGGTDGLCRTCRALTAIEDRIDGITSLLGTVRRNAAIAERELASLERAFQAMLHGPIEDEEEDLGGCSKNCC
jgi:hypothetical protein